MKIQLPGRFVPNDDINWILCRLRDYKLYEIWILIMCFQQIFLDDVEMPAYVVIPLMAMTIFAVWKYASAWSSATGAEKVQRAICMSCRAVVEELKKQGLEDVDVDVDANNKLHVKEKEHECNDDERSDERSEDS